MSRRLENRPLQGCLLVTRIDDLDTSIFAAEGISRLLQVGLAVADRHQLAHLDPIFLREEPPNRLGAAFG